MDLVGLASQQAPGIPLPPNEHAQPHPACYRGAWNLNSGPLLTRSSPNPKNALLNINYSLATVSTKQFYKNKQKKVVKCIYLYSLNQQQFLQLKKVTWNQRRCIICALLCCEYEEIKIIRKTSINK